MPVSSSGTGDGGDFYAKPSRRLSRIFSGWFNAETDFAEFMESKTHDAFHRLGYLIAGWPWTCIVFSVIAAFVLGAGVINFKEVNNVRDHFSADDSPSRYEFAVAREFFKELGSPFHVVVAMQAADGGSLLREKYINKALQIEDYLQYKLKVVHEGRRYAYSDFCGAQCEASDAVNIFLTMYKDVQFSRKSSVKLTFPTIDVYGHRIYLANNIFKVQVNNRSKLVEGAQLITINFHAIYPNATMETIMKKWEHAVLDYSLASLNDPLIHLYTTSEGLVSEEVRRTGVKALPLMSVTFLVILTFTVCTSLKADPVKSKPWEAFFGVLCPMLSLCGSFGILFWLGFEFLPIVTVVPFLILAIGVDDVFIFLHCWTQTDGLDVTLRERVALVLADAGPSITITSLTNLLSFGIGIFTPTPAIRVFCIFIFVAVLFDYFYQIILYTAMTMIFGLREKRRLNAYVPCIKVPLPAPPPPTPQSSPTPHKRGDETSHSSYTNSTASSSASSGGGSSASSTTAADDTGAAVSATVSVAQQWRRAMDMCGTRLVDAWVDAAMSWWARIGLAVVLLCYWSFSIYGVAQIKVGLTSEKLFLDDSPLLELVRLQTDVIFREGGQMAVFVNNPHNLCDPEVVPEMMKILERFERAEGSVGSSSTQMWLNHYLPFIGLQNRGSIDFNYKYLPDFFANTEFHRWSHFVSMGNPQDCLAERPSCVHKFFFSTGFRNAVAWADRLELLQMWRQIASEYAHYNLTIYEDFSMYSDQLLTIPPVTKQTVLYALLCMAAVLIVFTPHQSTILPGVAAVMSINLGVFGLLFYWNIDLDPISMTTTLMAIGLSVDFVAHISFHYYKGDFENRRERLRHALVSIAWPMVQAGTSTILSLLILVTIHAYMVQVFVKVVVLVVSLGLLHGLVVLPIVYACIPFTKKRRNGGGGAAATKAGGTVRRRASQIAPTKIAIRGDASPDLSTHKVPITVFESPQCHH